MLVYGNRRAAPSPPFSEASASYPAGTWRRPLQPPDRKGTTTPVMRLPCGSDRDRGVACSARLCDRANPQDQNTPVSTDRRSESSGAHPFGHAPIDSTVKISLIGFFARLLAGNVPAMRSPPQSEPGQRPAPPSDMRARAFGGSRVFSRRQLLVGLRREVDEALSAPLPDPGPSDASPPAPATPPPNPARPSPRPARPVGEALLAVIDTSWCLAHRGEPCRSCVDVCPTTGALSLTRGATVFVPIVDPTLCTACGECERVCPTEPPAIYLPPLVP
jgi:ferredoxin